MALDRITVDPHRMRGLPRIRDTRVTVSAVLGQLAAGASVDDVLADYPYLERDDVLAALEYAATDAQERELQVATPGVRLLFDANLSPEVARRLKVIGHDAIHVGELGLLTASDPEIMEAAAEADRILVTADSDFAAMLALGGARSPSVVLLRSADRMRPPEQAALLAANLSVVGEDLERGAIVSLTSRHLRVRELPIDREG